MIAAKRYFPEARRLRPSYESGEVVPLACAVPYRDPFDAYRHFYGKGASVFLDSARYHPQTATHSFIGVDPIESFRWSGSGNPIPDLRQVFSRWRKREWEEFPYFTGGGVGFVSYDALCRGDARTYKKPREVALPQIYLILVRDVVVFDHRHKSAWVVTNLLPERDGSFEDAYRTACRRLERLESRLEQPLRRETNGHLRIRDFRSNLSPESFEGMVLKAKAYIRAGDIYQANLSQRFTFGLRGNPLNLYERLRQINPSPFSAYLDFGELQIASASPERLIRLRKRSCDTRPIAGTRPRGKGNRDLARYSRELLLSPKERAEHLMLLDLERNDLGRVCDYRSVRVDEMMALERYSHVIHIVSHVTGKLAANKDRFDLFEAMFPGGTITGCPKIRCMEIIEELEPCARGLYTGSIGYFAFDGDMDWNIVIRTLVIERGRAMIQTGAGIVYDSIPRKEYEETLHKAQALLEACGIRDRTVG